jgi:hypothetical protein
MKWSGLVCVALLATAPLALAQPVVAIYPSTEQDDLRGNYYVRLLDLALKKSAGRYQLQPSKQYMVSPRVVQQMIDGTGVNVTWAPTSAELEQSLLAVRIPLDKGVLGWRLLLIKKADRARFAAVHTQRQLSKLSAGQQRDWSDTVVLRANGLPVVAAGLYQPMFQMLASDRFQYFPRGVGEVWDEAKQNAHLDLEVEPHLALHYPVQTYFFVSRHNPALARRIELGLRAAMRDGSFEALFEQCNGDAIRRARLSSRTVIELRNPLETPLAGDTTRKRGGLYLSTAPINSED